MRRGFLVFLAGLWVAVFVVASPASAQNPVAAASALFKEAKELAKEGKWAEACPKFEKSYELDEQLGTLLNLADCYDNLGKVATAWARYSDGLEWAKRENDQTRIDFAKERIRAVEAKLPRLTVSVVHPVETLTIRRGDVVVDAAMWGSAIPVDPGTITLGIFRGEKLLETRDVEARLGETAAVKIDLADVERRHPAPKPAPAPVPIVRPSKPTPEPEREPYDPTHRNVGLIVGAIGLAGVLTAVGFEVAALVKKEQAEEPDACVNKFCSQAGLDDAEAAATFAEVGQWVGIGGLVVLAVGATIFFTAPSEDDDTDARVTPWFGPDGGGLAVGGRF